MLAFLHTLPDIVILLLVVVAVAGLATAAPFVTHRLFGIAPDKARDDAAFDAYKALMAMVGVVLAFSLVQANNNLRNDDAVVAHEASVITTIDRILQRFGSEEAARVRPLLNRFGESEVREEWTSLARESRSDMTDTRYSALSQAIRSLNPATPKQEAAYAELLKNLDELSDTRESLIQDADDHLPVFFWIVTLGFLAMGLMLALATEATLIRAAGLGGTAAGVALLLAFVIIVDEPFKGETSVRPDPIQKALILNSRRS